MHKAIRTLSTIASVVVCVGVLAACGGSDGKVVATVGKSTISQATLSHWMAVDVAGDYREQLAQTSPDGLVSDPADYPRCVAAAKTIATSSGTPTKLSDNQLLGKCRQLHTAVKEQALIFLISALWNVEEEAEHGHHVSEAEISRVLKQSVYSQYANPAQFKRYLTQHHRSLSDERYLLKRNILNQKFINRLKSEAGSGGEKAFVKLVLSNNAKWTARTDCKPGYRAPACRQHRSSEGEGASPSITALVEGFRAGS
jgi:hypothetical protein